MNTAMRNGLILGVLFSINFLITTTENSALGLITYLIVGLIVYLTYRYTVHYRDTELGGAISFGRAYLFVIVQFFFASIISAFVKYFYLRYSKTSFLEDMFNQSMEVMEKILPTVSGEMYDAMEVITDPQSYTLMTAWTNILLALILGLIIAAIVKRKRFPFDF